MFEFEKWSPVWRKVEFATVAAVAITLLCVIVGQTVEQIASTSVIDIGQDLKQAPTFNAIDYTANGSTKVVIGPCATR